MEVNRRRTLGLLGSALAVPFTLRSAKAAPVEYVKICDMSNAGFFYIPGGNGSDIVLAKDGLRVSWVNWDNNSFIDGKAYTSFFDFAGTQKSGPVQLGDAAGLTDGGRASLITTEGLASGKSVNFFCSRVGTTSDSAIFSEDVSKTGVELWQPVRISDPAGTGFSTLFSTPLANGDFAVAYTVQLGNGIQASIRIADPNGTPVGAEKSVAKSNDSGVANFVTGVTANDDTIFCTFARIANGQTKFGVQRFDFDATKMGMPTWILPPKGKDIFGSPVVLPANGGAFQTFFQATVGAVEQSDLYFRKYAANGAPGALKHIGQNAIDSAFSTLLDRPNSIQTRDGHFLTFTDAVESFFAWYCDKNGVLLDRRVFRRRRRRKHRNRRIRFIRGVDIPASPHALERAKADVYAALWHEIDETVSPPQTTWHAEVFKIQA